jgi:hypothetical protein
MTSRALALAIAAMLGLTGCPSIQSVQTAETVGEGNFQFAIEPGVIGVAGGGTGGVLPTINLSARYGITDRFDLGGRFGTSLIELHVKYMFTDPSTADSTVQAALAPQLGGVFIGGAGASAGYGWLTVPVLIDIPVGEHDFVIGPRAQVIFVGAGGASGAVLNVGSSVGFAAKVGKAARILPEFALVVPVFAGAGGETAFVGEGALFTVNVGILLGGRESASAE